MQASLVTLQITGSSWLEAAQMTSSLPLLLWTDGSLTIPKRGDTLLALSWTYPEQNFPHPPYLPQETESKLPAKKKERKKKKKSYSLHLHEHHS
jgi:hypothetical protein